MCPSGCRDNRNPTMKVPSLSIFTFRSRLHEGIYGSGKYFLLKMITTYVVVLGFGMYGGFFREDKCLKLCMVAKQVKKQGVKLKTQQ